MCQRKEKLLAKCHLSQKRKTGAKCHAQKKWNTPEKLQKYI